MTSFVTITLIIWIIAPCSSLTYDEMLLANSHGAVLMPNAMPMKSVLQMRTPSTVMLLAVPVDVGQRMMKPEMVPMSMQVPNDMPSIDTVDLSNNMPDILKEPLKAAMMTSPGITRMQRFAMPVKTNMAVRNVLSENMVPGDLPSQISDSNIMILNVPNRGMAMPSAVNTGLRMAMDGMPGVDTMVQRMMVMPGTRPRPSDVRTIRPLPQNVHLDGGIGSKQILLQKLKRPQSPMLIRPMRILMIQDTPGM